ncbi:MAG: D-glycero-beta-D-manno-heptose 1-phosphate adenylyltransferase [Bacteroidota bacterium]
MKTSDKIMPLAEVVACVRSWQNAGNKVVFSNGCFDILHLGHTDYLEKARALGQKLVVGLNTDESVKKLKGVSRPVNNELSRARILAALAFVDAVVLFNEDTPYELIKAIRPTVLVKGDDYLAENIVGADIVKANGGEVKTVSLVEGYSTSLLIEKIKKI